MKPPRVVAVCVCVVSEGVGARAVLVFGDRHLHAAEPVLRRHQEARVSASGRRQALHGQVLQGLQPRSLLIYQHTVLTHAVKVVHRMNWCHRLYGHDAIAIWRV